MNLDDALTITFLGIAVVFTGLILTSLMIYLFSLLDKFSARKNQLARSKKGTTAARETKQTRMVDPEILAVIAAVLEVEFRLSVSLEESKYTFKR